MRQLFYDFETEGSLRLDEVGSAKYISKAKVTWIAWAIDHGEIEVREWGDEARKEFAEAVKQADELIAHRAIFDLLVIKFHAPEILKLLSPKYRRLGCTACMAGFLNLPRKLAVLADLLELPQKKKIEHEVTLFGSNEAEWREYVRHDVWLCREIYGEIRHRVPSREKDLIDIHLRMQGRGLAIDLNRLHKLGKEANADRERIDGEFRKITGLSPTQHVKLKTWFHQVAGVNKSSKKDLEREDKSLWPDKAKAAFALLVERSANELAKLRKMKDAHVDGFMYDTLNHANTVTNRWAGCGAHMHNAAREGEVRSTVVARKGRILVDADLSQIEVRVGLWVAGMEQALQDLHERDWYMELTQEIYGSDHDPKMMKELRRRVKQGVIGVMYSAGVASVMQGIKGTHEEAEYVLNSARPKLKPVTDKSVELYNAWREVAEREEEGFRRSVRIGPGGRSQVVFARPRSLTKPFEKAVVMLCPRGQIVYRDLRQVRNDKGNLDWRYMVGEVPKFMEHKGRLFENVASTIAREVLVAAIINIDRNIKQMRPVTTVHDEILVEVDEALADQNPRGHVFSGMINPIKELEGLPLNSEVGVGPNWKEAKEAAK